MISQFLIDIAWINSSSQQVTIIDKKSTPQTSYLCLR
jgi:hypothetical protein